MRLILPLKNYRYLLRLDRFYIKFRQTIDLVWMTFESLYDMANFIMHGRLSPFVPSHKKDTYDLIFFSHTIEKGLSLPKPRLLFGKNNIARIIHLLRHCDPTMVNTAAVQMALGSLNEYIDFHRKNGIKDIFLDDLHQELSKITAKLPIQAVGGTRDVLKDNNKLKEQRLSYTEFLSSRFSCRNFSNNTVPANLLKDVVLTAQNAPSQCNRQSTRIHGYMNKEVIARLLALQGGSSGFAASVPLVLVVSSEVAAWSTRAERNQAYVDSGLFGMALLYSCHAHGLGSCCLNFAKTNLQERAFKKVAGISAGERITMLIAVGYLDETNAVAARSTRCPLDTVFKLNY